MKKTAIFLTVFLLSLIAFSCDDGTTSQPPPSTPTQKPTKADVTYLAAFAADELSIFDISVKYTDAAGAEQTVTMTMANTPWEIKLTDVQLPFTARLKLEFSKKGSIASKAIYTTGYAYRINYTTTDGGSIGSCIPSSLPIVDTKLDEYITKVLGTTYEQTQEIPEDD